MNGTLLPLALDYVGTERPQEVLYHISVKYNLLYHRWVIFVNIEIICNILKL